MKKVLVIDNYDSFVYNVIQLLREAVVPVGYDIVRNDKRIGQERPLNGGRAIQQNVIVGVQSCLIERLPETEKALDGIGKRAYRSVYVQIGRDQIQPFVFGRHGRCRKREPGKEVCHCAGLLVWGYGSEGQRRVSLRITVHNKHTAFAFSEAIRYVNSARGLAYATFVVCKSNDFRCHEILQFACDVSNFLHDTQKKSMIILNKSGKWMRAILAISVF